MVRDQSKPALLTRIDTEIAAGRLWRAKEIIRGTIANTWPAHGVIERYGQLLLRMGDDVEAGKYLWLSGVRRDEYEPAIALFLHRHGRHGRENLLAQIPKSFRRTTFSELPLEIQNELTKYGVRGSDLEPDRRTAGQTPASARWKGALLAVVVIGSIVCVIVGFGVGFYAVVRWIVRVLK